MATVTITLTPAELAAVVAGVRGHDPDAFEQFTDEQIAEAATQALTAKAESRVRNECDWLALSRWSFTLAATLDRLAGAAVSR
jgi:hypothetical protein